MLQTIDQLVRSRPRRATGTRIEQFIGQTPLLDLSQLSPDPENIHIFAKAEWFNPGGSIKDRAALNIVQTALARGELQNGRRLLDASSGNTALSYAMLGAAMGFGVTLCIPENISPLQRALLQAYGAEVIYTSAQEGSDGAIRMAQQLSETSPQTYFYADQYSNPANWQAHYHGTAVEIWQQTRGRVTHFIAGLGTSGTFTGTGRRLRKFNPQIRLISLQPDSPFHGLEGLKYMAGAIVPKIYDPQLADQNLFISTEEAYQYVKRLVREQGLLVGL
ncbi:MAG: pyridoxal-phosphate dependent enzyme, partial [Calditrichaeota bacterium]